MTNKGRKLEPPLYLDLPFNEAIARFIQTKPDEVEQLERQKKAAKDKPGGPLSGTDDPPSEESG